MTLVRWNPYRELAQLSERLDRMINEGYTTGRREDGFGSWIPPVDIFEKAENLVIRVEVPGIDKDDLDVQIENGVLTLRGERHRDQDVTDENAYRVERLFGSFTRSFTLPTTVDPSRVGASYKDGILEIVVPKMEEAKPKKVKIQAA